MTDRARAEAVDAQRTGVAVLGAGIVGLINAIQLARRGVDVTLIDDIQHKKRSYKVGESLLIFTNAFLRTIGDLDEFIQESFPKAGVWFTYGMEHKRDFADAESEWAFESPIPARWYDHARNKRFFRSLFKDGQVVRPEAEDILLEQVRGTPGVRVLDAALARDVTLGDGEADHEIRWQRKDTGETGVLRARWIMDCSGRNRFLARRMGHDIPLGDDFQTTASWAQFGSVTDELFDDTWVFDFPDGGSVRRDHNTVHLWGVGYWIWVIRLSKDRISVGVTWDQRLSPPGRDFKEQFWHFIDRYPSLRAALSPEQALEWRTFRNVQHMTDTFVSPRRYAMAGDAGSIIDALYSQGISLALVTSWHVANIVEKDVVHGELDRRYIARVNEATVQDWQMMRTTTRVKYSPAIADSRFFLLTHMMDYTVFSAAMVPRFRLTRWLVDTLGDPGEETARHRKIRRYLARRLYYSATPPWSFLRPATVSRIQRHLQEGLQKRALWRLEHGVRPRGIRSIIRTTAPLPPLWQLPFKRGPRAEITPPEIVEPKFLRIRGDEIQPLPIRMAGPMLVSLFLAAYAADWLLTGVSRLRLLVTRGGHRYPEAVAWPPAPAAPPTQAAAAVAEPAVAEPAGARTGS